MSFNQSPYQKGLVSSLPFLLVVVPFGLLFGVLALDAGHQISEIMGFSSIVMAGASQITAVSMLQDNAPLLIIIATSFAVNLRMAMYSASLTPHIGKASLTERACVSYVLIDQTYALSIAEFEKQPKWSMRDKLSYFWGTATTIIPLWIAGTAAGIYLGNSIPEWMALDFAVPICFLALIGPMLRTIPHMVAALTSIVLALLFSGMPYNLGLICAAIPAMLAGAITEQHLENRANKRAHKLGSGNENEAA